MTTINDYIFPYPGYEDLELSTQLIIQSAHRRDINVEILNRRDNVIKLQKGSKKEYIRQATYTSLDSCVSHYIMSDKGLTKKILSEHGFKVPAGKSFDCQVSAYEYIKKNRHLPLVVKPLSTNYGIGITMLEPNDTREQIQLALNLAFSHDDNIIVEEFISGQEYRYLVIGNRTVGVTKRVPANIIGDGSHDIEELIAEKNRDPRRQKGYITPLEKLNNGPEEANYIMTSYGYTFKTVPEKDEQVFLRKNSNISTGGDSYDITNEVPDYYKDLAVEIAKSINVSVCGIDLIIDHQKPEPNYCVLELNFNPALQIHATPYAGPGQPVSETILDLLGF
jgi:glutamate--cysteine ligase